LQNRQQNRRLLKMVLPLPCGLCQTVNPMAVIRMKGALKAKIAEHFSKQHHDKEPGHLL